MVVLPTRKLRLDGDCASFFFQPPYPAGQPGPPAAPAGEQQQQYQQQQQQAGMSPQVPTANGSVSTALELLKSPSLHHAPSLHPSSPAPQHVVHIPNSADKLAETGKVRPWVGWQQGVSSWQLGSFYIAAVGAGEKHALIAYIRWKGGDTA